jgi:hypothetical protein
VQVFLFSASNPNMGNYCINGIFECVNVTEQYTISQPLAVVFYGRHLKLSFNFYRLLLQIFSIPSSLLLVLDKNIRQAAVTV